MLKDGIEQALKGRTDTSASIPGFSVMPLPLPATIRAMEVLPCSIALIACLTDCMLETDHSCVGIVWQM
jgi:hypothetical protein